MLKTHAVLRRQPRSATQKRQTGTQKFFILSSLVIALAVFASPHAHAQSTKVPATTLAQWMGGESLQINRLQQLDTHASNVPAAYEQNVNTLLPYLLEPAETPVEKIRLIYTWITTRFSYAPGIGARYVRQQLETGNLQTLQNKGLRCDGYGVLFQELAKRAGFNVKTVEGVARNPGDRTPNKPNHMWDAVEVNGQWWLVDPTWGAGSVASGQYQQEPDNYFFLAPLEAFALTHYDFDDRFGAQTRLGLDWNSFRRLPEEASGLVYAGFDVPTVVRFYQSGGKQAVRTFDQPYGTFVATDMPLTYRLSAGLLNFSIQTGQYEQLMVVQGDNWQRFQRSGQRFIFNGAIGPGEVLIMGKLKGQDDYEALLEYRVL